MHNGLFRYFRNETRPARFIQDPFHHIILEEKGEISAHDLKRKVGFQELFYDLFVVAALSVYTADDDLNTGVGVASYIVFFAAIWTVWASQTVFDVRYGTKDGMMWIFGYVQLCVFGVFAALSGDFNLDLGFGQFEDSGASLSEEKFHWLTNDDHYVRRPNGELKIEDATLRSFKSASATYAVSRLVLLTQYFIVLYYARKHKRPTKPVWWHIGGLVISTMMWFSALATTFYPGRHAAIARLSLWIIGLAFEFGCTAAAAATQPAYKLDLEYWAERFSALTLIVLGEGIISLFEAFRSVLRGVASDVDKSSRANLAGLIFSAIGLYRLLYYLYFEQHTHHIRGGAVGHGAWGCVHFPLHLCILLLTQCSSHTIFATNVFIVTDSLLEAFGQMMEAISGAIESNDMTVVGETLLNSTAASAMQHTMGDIGVDWNSHVGNMLTYASGNISKIPELLYGEEFSSIAQMFANYGFTPEVETYEHVDSALNAFLRGESASHAMDEFVVLLMKPLYVSMQYGLTVLGGFFVSLAVLSMLQHGPASFHTSHHQHQHKHKRPAMFYHRISMFYRFGLGIALLLLTLLDIGPFYSNAEQTGWVAPIYSFTNGNIFLPAIFLLALSAAIVDFCLFLWRQHYEKSFRVQPAASQQTQQSQVSAELHSLPRLTSTDSTVKDGQDLEKPSTPS